MNWELFLKSLFVGNERDVRTRGDGALAATYDVSFENGYLILSAKPGQCDEGCAEKFQKWWICGTE